MRSTNPLFVRGASIAALVIATSLLGGCAVITVASAAVGVVTTGVGLAVDATVGTVKAVGGAVLPSGDNKK